MGHPEFGKIHVCTCNVLLRDGHVAFSGLDEHERSIRLSGILTDAFPGHARMLEALQDFVTRPAGMLTIYGGPGNGKTFAVKAAVNELIERGQEAIYVRVPELVTCTRQALYPSGDVKSDLAHQRLKRIEAAPVLVLDDLDRVHESRGTQEQIDALIERRCDRAMQGSSGTILVMNSDPADQPDWLRSRLFDGRNRVVHNDDPDLRPSMRRKES